MALDYSTETATQLIPMAPGAGASPVHRGINMKRLLRMRGPVMLAIAAALAVPLLAAVWFVVPREFEAVAAIRFSHTRPTVLSSDEKTAVASDYGQYVETQVNLIKSPAVLGLVAARDDVRRLPTMANRKDPALYLEKNLNVRTIPNSELVQISYKSSDSQTALVIVSATVNEYLKQAALAERTSAEQVTRLLVDEQNTLEERLSAKRTEVNERRKNVGSVISDSGGAGVDAERQSYYDNLSKAMADKSTSEHEMQQYEAQLQQIRALIDGYKSKPGEPIHEFGVESMVDSDPAVLVQTNQLADMDVQYQRDKGVYRDDAPAMKAKAESRKAVETALENAKRKAREKALLALESQTRLKFETAKKTLDDASERVSKFDDELRAHAADTIEYGKAMSELKEAETELAGIQEDLRDIRSRIRVAMADSRAPASFSIAVPAQVPEVPDIKRRLKFMMLVLMMACGVGFAFGLYREVTDQQVRTPQDLRYVTDLPMMALIPDASIERLPNNTTTALLTAEHPESITADEFRRVLTRIIYPPEGTAELNTVLVTSASRGDGKTSLAVNLAVSLAQANRRVLLLDICARRPSVEKALGLERAPGLGEVFANRLSMENAVRSTNIDNLYVLGPGFMRAEVIGKLASRDTVEFLEKAEGSFEHVIIDSPPALLMSDAKLLAPVVDGVIMVVGAEVSSLGMVRRALGELQQIGANVIGVVLNRAKHVAGGYMRENMDKFYHYGKETGASAELEDSRDDDEPVMLDGVEDLPTMLLTEDRIRPKQQG